MALILTKMAKIDLLPNIDKNGPKTNYKLTENFATFRCEIVEDFVFTPVCVNVTDQELDKKCEMVIPEVKPPEVIDPGVCYTKECKNVDTTKLVKECKPVMYEECDVEIEEIVKTECKNFTTNSTEQVCEDKKEKKCKQDFVYVCEEKLPKYGYAHPHPPAHPHPGPHPHPPPVTPLPKYGPTTIAPTLYRHSTTLAPSYEHKPEVLPPVRVPKYGEKWRVRRDAAGEIYLFYKILQYSTIVYNNAMQYSTVFHSILQIQQHSTIFQNNHKTSTVIHNIS